jgi:hypothetical protein
MPKMLDPVWAMGWLSVLLGACIVSILLINQLPWFRYTIELAFVLHK